MAENVYGCKVDTLHSDPRGESISKDFNAFLADRGIKNQCTMPYTPQQNGIAERKNRSLMEMAQCMVKSQYLPHSFWLEAFMCATYVLNRCPTKALKSITFFMFGIRERNRHISPALWDKGGPMGTTPVSLTIVLF